VSQQLVTAPVLETERLRLRPYRADDLPEYAAMWADPLVTRHIGGTPLSMESAWWKILRHAGHWALLGFGYWVVEERASERLVGEVGFVDFKRDITPSLAGTPEIGWALVPRAHGAGFATEAARAAIAWGDARFSGAPTVCLIAPENAASIRVAAKCGYREHVTTTYAGAPMVVFRRGA
jgi:RimJ/RimL family protein N-acetyltransferase